MDAAHVFVLLAQSSKEYDESVAFAWAYQRDGLVLLNHVGFMEQLRMWRSRNHMHSIESEKGTLQLGDKTVYAMIVRAINPKVVMDKDPVLFALTGLEANGITYFFKDKQLRDDAVNLLMVCGKKRKASDESDESFKRVRFQ